VIDTHVLLVPFPPPPPSRAAVWTPLVAASFILLVGCVVGVVIVRMSGGVPALTGWRYGVLVLICVPFVLVMCIACAAAISSMTGNGPPSFSIGVALPIAFASAAATAGVGIWRLLVARKGRVEFDDHGISLLRPLAAPVRYARERTLLVLTIAQGPAVAITSSPVVALGCIISEGYPTVAFQLPDRQAGQ